MNTILSTQIKHFSNFVIYSYIGKSTLHTVMNDLNAKNGFVECDILDD